MNKSPQWESPLGRSRKEKASEVANEIGARLSDERILAHALACSAEQSDHFSWQGNEYSGLTILFSYQHRLNPLHNFDLFAHKQLQSALAHSANTSAFGPSLYGGIAGIGLAAHLLSQRGTRYQRLLAGIDATLNKTLLDKVEQMNANNEKDISFTDYDVLYGVSGSAGYLLHRAKRGVPQPALKAVLTKLVALSNSSYATPASLLVGPFAHDSLYRDGLVNCGLAHGVPGPLAVLSLARSQNLLVEKMNEAIRTNADFLLANSITDDFGLNWPAAVALDVDGCCLPPSRVSQAGWCYGSPGVANSLWLAGESLHCDIYKERSVAAIESMIRRLPADFATGSPSFCHGIAGRLQIVMRFYNRTGSQVFAKAAKALFDELISLYDPSSLLGFRDILSNRRAVDSPRLIDGAAGIALVLLSATHNTEPDWDRLFMLS